MFHNMAYEMKIIIHICAYKLSEDVELHDTIS